MSLLNEIVPCSINDICLSVCFSTIHSQSFVAYMLETEAKMAQEIRPFLKISDSFKKIVITSDIPKPFYNDQCILIMNIYDFLLNADSLEL